jgi:hypothetical protein
LAPQISLACEAAAHVDSFMRINCGAEAAPVNALQHTFRQPSNDHTTGLP